MGTTPLSLAAATAYWADNGASVAYEEARSSTSSDEAVS